MFDWSAFSKLAILFLTLIPRECHAINEYNLGLKKRTYISTLVDDHTGRLAVDGNTNDKYAHAGNSKGDPWIVVDLGRPHRITGINLHRCDTCVNHEYAVGLLNNFDYKRKTNWTKLYEPCPEDYDSPFVVFFSCESVTQYFRYVMIQSQNVNEDVIIREVEVLGYNLIYFGCYENIIDEVDTAIQVDDVIGCFANCFDLKKPNYHAALKDEKCSCALNMENLLPLNKCGKLCKNGSSYCGGPKAYSVYKDSDPKSFKSDHHCKSNTPLNDDSICENELCEDGWTGDSCSSRDCSVSNGACGQATCNKVEMPFETTGECVCDKGYVKLFWWENCREYSNASPASATIAINVIVMLIVVEAVIANLLQRKLVLSGLPTNQLDKTKD